MNVTDYGHCEMLVTTVCRQKICNQEQAQKIWGERFISPVVSGVSAMSAIDCSNWLDKTKDLPPYLSQKMIEAYKAAQANVELQLHKSRVQGVFVMYDKLSEEEKQEFWRMIGR